MIAGVCANWRRILGILGILLVGFCMAPSAKPQVSKPDAKGQTPVDFNRQILPLLSENCFACHGPDAGQRKAKLRLDTKEGAFAELRSGGYAIVPGKSSESKMIAKITVVDPKDRMPPAKTGKQLKPEQIALLKQWIDQGARWTEHWAWTAPQRPVVPPLTNVRGYDGRSVRGSDGARNPIDNFILARLEKEALRP